MVKLMKICYHHKAHIIPYGQTKTIWSAIKKDLLEDPLFEGYESRSNQAIVDQFTNKRSAVVSFLKLDEETSSNLSDENGELGEIETIVKMMWHESRRK